MARWILGVVAAVLAFGTEAAEPLQAVPVQTTPRVELFQRTTSYCMALHLGNAELVENVMRAGAGPVRNLCECAAMLTISRMSDDQVHASLGGDVQALTQGIGANLSRCAVAG